MTELLKRTPGSHLLISKVVPAYNEAFGKEFDATRYGQTKLIKVLEAIPDTIRVSGAK